MDNPYGTIQTYRNAIAIKKHNAIIESWASPMALEVATLFWATWKGIESRLPTGKEVIEAEKPRDSRDLKNKYSAIIRVEVKRHSDELQKTLSKYIYNVHLAGAVEQSRDLGCTTWYFSSLSKSSTFREAIRTPDGTLLQEAEDWVSLPNTQAQKYADSRAAEAVTQINDTTRKAIADIVSQGVANGSSYDDIANAIKAKFEEFAVPKPQAHIANRAVLVAVTELANAYCEGNASVGTFLQDSGVKMMKCWRTLEDSRVSDGCRENERVGWIPIDKEFPSGHKHPPRFPGCRCDFFQDLLDKDSLGKQYSEKPEPSTVDGPDAPVDSWGDYRVPEDSYNLNGDWYKSQQRQYMSDINELKDADMFDDKWESAKTPIKEAVGWYWGSSDYKFVNRYLRTGDFGNSALKDWMKDNFKSAIKSLDKVIKKNVLNKPIVVNRYLSSYPKELQEAIASDKDFTDNGFVSTTLADTHLFANKSKVTVHIYVPEGQGRGVYAQPILDKVDNNYTNSGWDEPVGDKERENEFTLARGTTFRIEKAVMNEKGGEIWMSVVD